MHHVKPVQTEAGEVLAQAIGVMRGLQKNGEDGGPAFGRSEIAAVVSLIEPEMTVPQRLANPRRGTR